MAIVKERVLRPAKEIFKAKNLFARRVIKKIDKSLVLRYCIKGEFIFKFVIRLAGSVTKQNDIHKMSVNVDRKSVV